MLFLEAILGDLWMQMGPGIEVLNISLVEVDLKLVSAFSWALFTVFSPVESSMTSFCSPKNNY